MMMKSICWLFVMEVFLFRTAQLYYLHHVRLRVHGARKTIIIGPMNYCNENKEKAGERHSIARHLYVTHPT